MHDKSLKGCRILVVEDEYLLADELGNDLVAAGATVIGPVGSLEEAIALIDREAHIDGAILDVNLGGKLVFPAADLLAARGVPIILTTGYDASMIPANLMDSPRCEKPIDMHKVSMALGRVLHVDDNAAPPAETAIPLTIVNVVPR